MSNRKILSELMEIAGTSSSAILAHTQAAVTRGVENEEKGPSKAQQAKALMKSLISGEDFDRQEILTKLMQALNITESTAISYFQRFAKEMGLTNLEHEGDNGGMVASEEEDTDPTDDAEFEEELEVPDEDMELDDEVPESDDPYRQGIIRVVKNAHLVYKRQNDEGTYDELWIYNTDREMSSDFEIRRDILSGTDIPAKKTMSDDGLQQYRLKNMGNAQMLEITGLPQ